MKSFTISFMNLSILSISCAESSRCCSRMDWQSGLLIWLKSRCFLAVLSGKMVQVSYCYFWFDYLSNMKLLLAFNFDLLSEGWKQVDGLSLWRTSLSNYDFKLQIYVYLDCSRISQLLCTFYNRSNSDFNFSYYDISITLPLTEFAL